MRNEQNSKGRILQGVSHMQFKERKGEITYHLKIVQKKLFKLRATCNVKRANVNILQCASYMQFKNSRKSILKGAKCKQHTIFNQQSRIFLTYNTHAMEKQ